MLLARIGSAGQVALRGNAVPLFLHAVVNGAIERPDIVGIRLGVEWQSHCFRGYPLGVAERQFPCGFLCLAIPLKGNISGAIVALKLKSDRPLACPAPERIRR